MPQIIDGFKLIDYLPIDDRIVTSGLSSRNNITYKYNGLRVWDLTDQIPYVWLNGSWQKENLNSAIFYSKVKPGFTQSSFNGSPVTTSNLLKVWNSETSELINSNITESIYKNEPKIGINFGSKLPDLTTTLDVNGGLSSIGFIGSGSGITDLNASEFKSGQLSINLITTGNGLLMVNNSYSDWSFPKLEINGGNGYIIKKAIIQNTPYSVYLVDSIGGIYFNDNLKYNTMDGKFLTNGYSFYSDSKSSFYLKSVGDLYFKINNSDIISIDTTNTKIANYKTINFLNEIDSGIKKNPTNDFSFLYKKKEVFKIDSNGVSLDEKISFNDNSYILFTNSYISINYLSTSKISIYTDYSEYNNNKIKLGSIEFNQNDKNFTKIENTNRFYIDSKEDIIILNKSFKNTLLGKHIFEFNTTFKPGTSTVDSTYLLIKNQNNDYLKIINIDNKLKFESNKDFDTYKDNYTKTKFTNNSMITNYHINNSNFRIGNTGTDISKFILFRADIEISDYDYKTNADWNKIKRGLVTINPNFQYPEDFEKPYTFNMLQKNYVEVNESTKKITLSCQSSIVQVNNNKEIVVSTDKYTSFKSNITKFGNMNKENIYDMNINTYNYEWSYYTVIMDGVKVDYLNQRRLRIRDVGEYISSYTKNPMPGITHVYNYLKFQFETYAHNWLSQVLGDMIAPPFNTTVIPGLMLYHKKISNEYQDFDHFPFDTSPKSTLEFQKDAPGFKTAILLKDWSGYSKYPDVVSRYFIFVGFFKDVILFRTPDIFKFNGANSIYHENQYISFYIKIRLKLDQPDTYFKVYVYLDDVLIEIKKLFISTEDRLKYIFCLFSGKPTIKSKEYKFRYSISFEKTVIAQISTFCVVSDDPPSLKTIDGDYALTHGRIYRFYYSHENDPNLSFVTYKGTDTLKSPNTNRIYFTNIVSSSGGNTIINNILLRGLAYWDGKYTVDYMLTS